MITLIATVFIARTNARQAGIAEGQLAISRKQADIMEGQLRITKTYQKPVLSYDIHKVTVKRTADRSSVESYNISLVWKNTGLTEAKRINYWMGHLLNVPTITHDIDMLFKSDNIPGPGSLAVQATVDTDVHTFSIDEMVLVYERRLRLYFWCIIRWSSMFEESGSFMETAILLEFVLEHDPRIFALTGPMPTSGPFRVAVTGERHREGRDA